jgi:hypothetical protein
MLPANISPSRTGFFQRTPEKTLRIRTVGFGPSRCWQQNDGPFHRNAGGEDLQLPFGNCQFSEATLQTNRDFGEDPHDRLVEAFPSTEVNRNLTVERGLCYGMSCSGTCTGSCIGLA